jgi:hypothetical protein
VRTLEPFKEEIRLTTPVSNRPLPLREMFLVLIGALAFFLLLAIASYSPDDPVFQLHRQQHQYEQPGGCQWRLSR